VRASGVPASIAPLLDERVDRDFVADSIQGLDVQVTRARLHLVVRCCDLTTLDPDDTPEKVTALAQRALRPVPADADCPPVAALCVLPHLVGDALGVLEGSSVVVACATGDFPAGTTTTAAKQAQIRAALTAGAQEIDAVANRGLLEHPSSFLEEVRSLREAAGDVPLKVILETGELDDLDLVRRAALLAAGAGADTIKTSTGKTLTGATLEAAFVMATVVAEVRRSTGRSVGLKVAGGIRTAAEACSYVELVDRTLGAEWLRPERFRIGASSLVDDVGVALDRL
jgi:deoxyribose-phosphate aldolase